MISLQLLSFTNSDWHWVPWEQGGSLYAIEILNRNSSDLFDRLFTCEVTRRLKGINPDIHQSSATSQIRFQAPLIGIAAAMGLAAAAQEAAEDGRLGANGEDVLGWLERNAEDCGRAIELDPLQSKAWLVRGLARAKLGQSAAEEDLVHFARLAPNSKYLPMAQRALRDLDSLA